MLFGSLQARFTRATDGSTKACVSARSPLELRGPFSQGDVPGYYLRNTTAGVLADDAYCVDLWVAESAAACVNASSASKVYAGASSLDVSLQVERDAVLLWGPHATILQAGAAYRQETRVSLTSVRAHSQSRGPAANAYTVSRTFWVPVPILWRAWRGAVFSSRFTHLALMFCRPDSRLTAPLGAGQKSRVGVSYRMMLDWLYARLRNLCQRGRSLRGR